MIWLPPAVFIGLVLATVLEPSIRRLSKKIERWVGGE